MHDLGGNNIVHCVDQAVLFFMNEISKINTKIEERNKILSKYDIKKGGFEDPISDIQTSLFLDSLKVSLYKNFEKELSLVLVKLGKPNFLLEKIIDNADLSAITPKFNLLEDFKIIISKDAFTVLNYDGENFSHLNENRSASVYFYYKEAKLQKLTFEDQTGKYKNNQIFNENH